MFCLNTSFNRKGERVVGIRKETHSRKTSTIETTNERGIPHAASSDANEASKGECGHIMMGVVIYCIIWHI